MPLNTAPTFIVRDGKVITDMGVNSYAASAQLQKDGKIIVVGSASDGSNYHYAVTRYNSDGTLDTSFGSGGKIISPLISTAFGVSIQADGKIVVLALGWYGIVLAKYDSTGQLDTSFGIGGIISNTSSNASNSYNAYDLLNQTDGKFLTIGGNEDFGINRFNVDGTLDLSFGVNGLVQTDFGSVNDGARALALQSDGKILAAGTTKIGNGYGVALARYNLDGSLDPSFDTDGKVIVSTGEGNTIYVNSGGISVQADGKILLTGTDYPPEGYGKLSLLRFNVDGSLDSSFNKTGKVLTSFAPTSHASGVSVVQQNDGKILVAGLVNNSINSIAISRYNIDGSLDLSFDHDGFVVTSIGGNAFTGRIILQEDGKFIVAGQAEASFVLIRYNTDGSLDSTFSAPENTITKNIAYTENQAPIVLSKYAQIFDAELSKLNNYDGASLILSRHDGANDADVFSSINSNLSTLSKGSYFSINGVTIGRVIDNSGGTLNLKFNFNATEALVNSAMQHIAYANSSDNPPSSVQIDWTFNDGNIDTQGTGGAGVVTSSTMITITPVNDFPQLRQAISNIVVPLNKKLSAALAQDTFVDPDGDKLIYSLGMADGTGVPPWLQIDSITGTLSGTPSMDDLGNLYVRITATDTSGASATGLANLNVVSNKAPVFNNVPLNLSPDIEDIGYGISSSILLTGWTDSDAGDTISVANLVADHGTVVMNSINHFVITPEPNYNGKMVLSYKVTDGINSVSTTQSYIVLPANDSPTGSVTISGTPTQNQTLTVTNNLADIDGIGAISYQWHANGVDIQYANQSLYKLTQTEVGKTMTVTASYIDGGGTAESRTSAVTAVVVNVNDSPTGSVTISGTFTQNQTLTVTNNLVDVDGIGAISYQWQANGVDIQNANQSLYKLTQSEVGKTMTVTASYIDGGGAAESRTSTVTAMVVNVNDAPTGNLAIDGIPKQGQVLTVKNSLIDLDGLGVVQYQWQANGVDIQNATLATYTLTQSEVGKTMTVVASYIDGAGASEKKASVATAAVASLNNLPTGSVTLSGLMLEGQTITALNLISDLDGISSSAISTFKWSANGEAITGANSSDLLLTRSLAGKAINVTVSYTDNLGNLESMSSKNSVSVGGKYVGTSGNDTLFGSAGSDLINGSGGDDIVSYSGSVSQHTIVRKGAIVSVIDKLGKAGNDTLTNVEAIAFSDKTINLQIQAKAADAPVADVTRLIELYVAFFNRVPDADGLAYWIGQKTNGLSTNQIAETFYSAGIKYSDLTDFSEGMSNAAFINVVYRNVLGRSEGADAGGLEYWGGRLVDRIESRGSLVSKILDSAHSFKGRSDYGWVADLLDNKIAVAKVFAIDFGINFNNPEDSIRNGMAIAAAVTPTDVSAALTLIGISPQDMLLS